ncbi:MAG: hypothetical protein V5A55_09010 [Halovenus sp.]
MTVQRGTVSLTDDELGFAHDGGIDDDDLPHLSGGAVVPFVSIPGSVVPRSGAFPDWGPRSPEVPTAIAGPGDRFYRHLTNVTL